MYHVLIRVPHLVPDAEERRPQYSPSRMNLYSYLSVIR